MVRRLVNQQKVVLPGKQHRQLKLGLLAAGQSLIGAVQKLLGQVQIIHLPGQPPAAVFRMDFLHHVHRQPAFVRYRVREVRKFHRGGNTPLIVIFSLQQVQERGFSPAVSAGEAQLPIRVNLKADMVKNGFIAAVVGKGKVGYLNQ